MSADGNVYTTVKIGNQRWTVENLKTKKYNDGTAIPLVIDNTQWAELTTGAYCYYDNNATNKDTYGALYNWYAVDTGKLAPEGWRIPADADWKALEDYLIANGYNRDATTTGNTIANAMAATTDWKSCTVPGTPGNDPEKNNPSGFSALPGGYRSSDGRFTGQSCYGDWWSATEFAASSAWHRYLYNSHKDLTRNIYHKSCGFSLRLVRDAD